MCSSLGISPNIYRRYPLYPSAAPLCQSLDSCSKVINAVMRSLKYNSCRKCGRKLRKGRWLANSKLNMGPNLGAIFRMQSIKSWLLVFSHCASSKPHPPAPAIWGEFSIAFELGSICLSYQNRSKSQEVISLPRLWPSGHLHFKLGFRALNVRWQRLRASKVSFVQQCCSLVMAAV